MNASDIKKVILMLREGRIEEAQGYLDEQYEILCEQAKQESEPVRRTPKSRAWYEALGSDQNPYFLLYSKPKPKSPRMTLFQNLLVMFALDPENQGIKATNLSGTPPSSPYTFTLEEFEHLLEELRDLLRRASDLYGCNEEDDDEKYPQFF